MVEYMLPIPKLGHARQEGQTCSELKAWAAQQPPSQQQQKCLGDHLKD